MKIPSAREWLEVVDVETVRKIVKPRGFLKEWVERRIATAENWRNGQLLRRAVQKQINLQPEPFTKTYHEALKKQNENKDDTDPADAG